MIKFFFLLSNDQCTFNSFPFNITETKWNSSIQDLKFYLILRKQYFKIPKTQLNYKIKLFGKPRITLKNEFMIIQEI